MSAHIEHHHHQQQQWLWWYGGLWLEQAYYRGAEKERGDHRTPLCIYIYSTLKQHNTISVRAFFFIIFTLSPHCFLQLYILYTFPCT